MKITFFFFNNNNFISFLALWRKERGPGKLRTIHSRKQRIIKIAEKREQLMRFYRNDERWIALDANDQQMPNSISFHPWTEQIMQILSHPHSSQLLIITWF